MRNKIRSYEIIRKSYFCVRTKIDKNTTNILKYFYILFHQTKIKKTKFASQKQYLFRLRTSTNAKKETQTNQSRSGDLLLCLKRNDTQTLFSSMCIIGTTCFQIRELEKTFLFMKVCRSSEIFLSAILLLSLKPVL